MTRQIIRIGAAVMTTFLVLLVFWQFRMVIVYVLISLMVAATLRPLFNRLVGRGFIARFAWIMLYLVVLGCLGFILFLYGQTAVAEIQKLAQSISTQDTWTLPAWLEGSPFQQTLVVRLPAPSQLFEAVTGDEGQLVLPALLGFTQNLGSGISAVFIILILSIYWSINQVHFERLWLSLLPSGLRKQARGIWRTIEPELGTYIRSEAIQSLLALFLLGLGYWLLGSPFPTFLALTSALAWLIPVMGAPLAVILPLLIGMLTSVQLSLLSALYTLAVLIALEVWVEPRLFKHRWTNPILTVVLLLALADAFGLVGIIVAPPLSVICQILWSRLVSRRAIAGAAAQVSDLKERQARVWDTIRAMEQRPPAVVTSSMQRLAALIEKAEPILPVGTAKEQSRPLSSVQPVSREGEPPAPTSP